jgi:hypothetical protein
MPYCGTSLIIQTIFLNVFPGKLLFCGNGILNGLQIQRLSGKIELTPVAGGQHHASANAMLLNQGRQKSNLLFLTKSKLLPDL